MWFEIDEAQRRVDRMRDLSRSAFVIALSALSAVAVLVAIFAMQPHG